MNNEFENIIDNIKPTYISKSNVHGNGLFALADITKHHCLGTLDGQYMSWKLYDKICEQYKSEQFNEAFFMEWNAITNNLLLTRPFRTKYSFINHSREPNLVIMYDPIRIVALENIKKDEELLLDYRRENLSDEYLNGHGKTYL